jgi:two-component system, OmpR family, response regulator MprA
MAILVVDDDAELRNTLERVLAAHGFEVALAADAPAAELEMSRRTFDAVVLDVMMPGTDGVELCAQLRREGDNTPILMLTARDAIRDRVVGLEAGADDYLVKPFANAELVARLRALLRRSTGNAEELSFGDLRLDTQTREVWRGERLVELSYTEYELLELFLRHPRQVLSRSALYKNVWGYDGSLSSNSLDVFVGRLRRKLEAGGESRLIQTVRGAGFALRER